MTVTRYTIDNHIYQALAQTDIFQAIDKISGVVYRELENRKTMAVVIGNHSCFVKYHKGWSLIEAVKNYLHGRRPIFGASREWHAIQACQTAGIRTLDVLAYGEQRRFFCHRHSFIITRALHNTVSLETLGLRWMQSKPMWPIKKALINQVADMVARLHRHHIAHRDCYLCHFMLDEQFVQQPIGQPSLYLIDLHRALQFTHLPMRWRIKDLGQLFFSVLGFGLNRHDYCRFLVRYFRQSLRQVMTQHARTINAIEQHAYCLMGKYYRKYPKQAAVISGGRPLLRHGQSLCMLEQGKQSYTLLLKHQTALFFTKKILRVRPKRRIVMTGTLNGQQVVAKLYYHRFKAYYHWCRERYGIRQLHVRGIRTPACYYVGRCYGIRAFIIIFEHIETMIETHAADQETMNDIMIPRIIPALAQAHDNGVLQGDCHPSNYLLTTAGAYTIDGADVSARNSIAPSMRYQQLAQLLIQLAPLRVSQMKQAMALYNRTSQEMQIDEEQMSTYLLQARRARIRLLMRRMTRACSTTRVISQLKRRIIMPMARLISPGGIEAYDPKQLDAWIQQARCLKAGNSATVAQGWFDEQWVVLKRYNLKTRFYWLRRCLRRSKAAKAWYYAHLLSFNHILTPQPLACVEQRWGPLRGKNYFLMSYLNGVSLDSYWQQATTAQQQALVRQFDRLFDTLYQLRLTHTDMKHSNFLVVADRLAVLDCDAIKPCWHRWWCVSQLRKARMRLLRNWPEQHTLHQQLMQSLCSSSANRDG